VVTAAFPNCSLAGKQGLFSLEVHLRLPQTYAEIVDEIVRFTSLPRNEVEHRVWMQVLEPGWNVLNDVERFGVIPHMDSENMTQLYRDGDGFIFETMVFWAKPDRRRWTEDALEQIKKHATQAGKPNHDICILIFGDGTGNDSLYLASHGFKVDYFDVPGSKTFNFAMKRFDAYGFLGRSIRPLPDYQSCLNQEYDIFISFEVLEHLSDPVTMIRDISSILKTGGIAIITDDFGNITGRLPTHLKANSKFVGQTPFLFLKNNLLLSWYSRQTLFKPMEFTKMRTISACTWLSLIRDYNVRSSLLAKYSAKLARFVEKLAYLKA
jgi:SAM-dependent methyltransferase